MNRPNWYSDQPPGGGANVPPFRAWTATQQLLTVLAAVFLAQLVFDVVGRFLALRADLLANPLQWYRFVTYSLLHDSQSLGHLAVNALTIFFIGSALEYDLGGKRRYFAFCAAAAAFAGLAWLIVAWLMGGATGPLIGASGIAFAMIVAFAAIDPQRTVMLIVIPMRAWALALVMMLFALFGALMAPDAGVAHTAHLGGGIFGFLWVRGRHRIEGLAEEWESRRAKSSHRREVDLRREVDRLLAKIHETGMSSLSRAERKFLESASRELQKKR
jgi:membrane associated rhomboid family serine protease